MVTIDYILVAALLISVVVGVFRGFFREALSLVTWIAAVWISFEFAHLLEPLLASVTSPALRIWSARIITFILVLIAGGLLNALIGILVDKTGLTGTDRLLGMLFGAARGILIVGVVVMVFRVLELDQEAWWDESSVVGLAEPLADWLQDFLHSGLEHLDEIIPPSDVVPDVIPNEAAAAQPG